LTAIERRRPSATGSATGGGPMAGAAAGCLRLTLKRRERSHRLLGGGMALGKKTGIPVCSGPTAAQVLSGWGGGGGVRGPASRTGSMKGFVFSPAPQAACRASWARDEAHSFVCCAARRGWPKGADAACRWFLKMPAWAPSRGLPFEARAVVAGRPRPGRSPFSGSAAPPTIRPAAKEGAGS